MLICGPFSDWLASWAKKYIRRGDMEIIVMINFTYFSRYIKVTRL